MPGPWSWCCGGGGASVFIPGDLGTRPALQALNPVSSPSGRGGLPRGTRSLLQTLLLHPHGAVLWATGWTAGGSAMGCVPSSPGPQPGPGRGPFCRVSADCGTLRQTFSEELPKPCQAACAGEGSPLRLWTGLGSTRSDKGGPASLWEDHALLGCFSLLPLPSPRQRQNQRICPKHSTVMTVS